MNLESTDATEKEKNVSTILEKQREKLFVFLQFGPYYKVTKTL